MMSKRKMACGVRSSAEDMEDILCRGSSEVSIGISRGIIIERILTERINMMIESEMGLNGWLELCNDNILFDVDVDLFEIIKKWSSRTNLFRLIEKFKSYCGKSFFTVRIIGFLLYFIDKRLILELEISGRDSIELCCKFTFPIKCFTIKDLEDYLDYVNKSGNKEEIENAVQKESLLLPVVGILCRRALPRVRAEVRSCFSEWIPSRTLVLKA